MININKKISIIFIFALVAYLSNFFWESWHSVYLYQSHSFRLNHLQLMTYASGVDMLLLLAVLTGGILLWRNFFWFRKLNAAKYSYFIVTSILIALVIEIKAGYIFKQWTYSELMPTVFGIGLSPLLQLAVTGLLSLWVVQKLSD